MSKKLWIYGCSFSTNYTRSVLKREGNTWYEYIAEKYDLDIKNYAQNGHGVVSTVTKILQTYNQWDKDDMVVIELPDPFRIDVPQVRDTFNIYQIRQDKGKIISQMSETIQEVMEFEGDDWVEKESISIWNGLVGVLELIENKNIYTWYIHYKKGGKHLNKLHEGSVMDWINETKSYISEEDKHFSPTGAKKFFDYISPKINYGN